MPVYWTYTYILHGDAMEKAFGECEFLGDVDDLFDNMYFLVKIRGVYVHARIVSLHESRDNHIDKISIMATKHEAMSDPSPRRIRTSQCLRCSKWILSNKMLQS